MKFWITLVTFLFVSIIWLGQSIHAKNAINIGSQNQDTYIETPRSGQSMDDVKKSFGQPLEIIQPIGEPPITRWTYHQFTVYFEHQFVIHSVKHKN